MIRVLTHLNNTVEYDIPKSKNSVFNHQFVMLYYLCVGQT